jgi:hypothetical protein
MTALTAPALTDVIPRICGCTSSRALQVQELDEHRALVRFHAAACPDLGDQPVSHDRMLELADVALYLLLVGGCGASTRTRASTVQLRSYETPAAGDLMLEARMMPVDTELSHGVVLVREAATGRLVGHGSGTYRIPCGRRSG